MASKLDGLGLSHKKDLVTAILDQLQREVADTTKAAQAAHSGATHEDAVAKSKYDTHGLELSYLAGSQYERAEKMATDLHNLRSMKITLFDQDDRVAVGTVVELAHPDASSDLYFLCPYGAGLTVSWLEFQVKVVSQSSPLGGDLMGAYVDDEVFIGNSPKGKIVVACL